MPLAYNLQMACARYSAETEIRAVVIIKYPKIASDFCADSRRGKGRIAVPCNPCRNAEAAQKTSKMGYFIVSAALRLRNLSARGSGGHIDAATAPAMNSSG